MELINLTDKMIDQAKTDKGGFTGAQIKMAQWLTGEDKWRSGLRGKSVSTAWYRSFFEAKHKYMQSRMVDIADGLIQSSITPKGKPKKNAAKKLKSEIKSINHRNAIERKNFESRIELLEFDIKKLQEENDRLADELEAREMFN